MSMGIRLDEKFQDRRKDGIDNPFMRQAVSSAQNRLRDGRLNAAGELGDWEAFRDFDRMTLFMQTSPDVHQT